MVKTFKNRSFSVLNRVLKVLTVQKLFLKNCPVNNSRSLGLPLVLDALLGAVLVLCLWLSKQKIKNFRSSVDCFPCNYKNMKKVIEWNQVVRPLLTFLRLFVCLMTHIIINMHEKQKQNIDTSLRYFIADPVQCCDDTVHEVSTKKTLCTTNTTWIKLCCKYQHFSNCLSPFLVKE